MKVKVCIGSSCHLKGSQAIAEKLISGVNDNNLKEKVEIAGSFCIGKCNRDGVTVQVDDEIYTGITTENFDAFFKNSVLDKVK